MLHPDWKDRHGLHQLSWRYTVLPFLEEHAIYDQLASGSWKFTAKYDPPSLPGEKPLRISVYQCPSTLGYPVYAADLQIRKETTLLYDSLATTDNESPIIIFGILIPKKEGVWYSYTRFFGEFQESPPDHWWKAAKSQYITDGLSNTILLGERAKPPGAGADEHWCLGLHEFNGSTRASVNLGGGLQSFHPGGVHAAFADGAVHFLRDEVDERALGALVGRQDGVTDISQ